MIDCDNVPSTQMYILDIGPLTLSLVFEMLIFLHMQIDRKFIFWRTTNLPIFIGFFLLY